MFQTKAGWNEKAFSSLLVESTLHITISEVFQKLPIFIDISSTSLKYAICFLLKTVRSQYFLLGHFIIADKNIISGLKHITVFGSYWKIRFYRQWRK